MNWKCFSLSLALLSMLAIQVHAQNLSQASAYDSCIEQSEGNSIKIKACITQETQRIMEMVEQKYEQLASNKDFDAWNQGTFMYSGNFKNLLDEWLAYRDRYCSLYGYSASPSTNEGIVEQLSAVECVLELTKRQNKDMDVILKNYNSEN